MAPRPSISIRRPVPGEAPATAALLRDAVPASVRPLTIFGQSGVAEWIAWSIRSGSGPSAFLVATAGDALCAAAEWRHHGCALFLNRIAVAPAYRQRGVATRLLQAGIDAFEAGAHVALDVFRGARVARRWYKRLGFRKSGRRKWIVGPLEAGTNLSSRPAPHDSVPNVRLRNRADAQAQHERFGFSTLRFVVEEASGAADHEVGRLGTDYFRITSPETVRTRPLRAALLALNPSRSLLYLSPVSSPKVPPRLREQAGCRADSLRLTAPRPALNDALSTSSSDA